MRGPKEYGPRVKVKKLLAKGIPKTISELGKRLSSVSYVALAEYVKGS